MLRVAAIILLVTSGAVFEAARVQSLLSASSSDLWGHLRVGAWILQSHSVPHSGVFSRSPERSWNDASWGFDALLAFAFRGLGMRSIPALQMGCNAALALVTFLLAGGLRGKFWRAVALSTIAQFILGGTPLGPGFISILLFAVELFLVMEFRSTGKVPQGNVRLLLGLPVLFLLWANLDEQFVVGIALLILYLAADGLERLAAGTGVHEGQGPSRSFGTMIAIMGLCVIAALINPNFYHPFRLFFSDITSSANRYLPGFQAMTFKQPQDYLLLLLTMGAFLALGNRRSRDLFQILLLIGCTLLSFHSQRDAWMATLGAIAILGEGARREDEDMGSTRTFERWSPAMAAALISMAILVAAIWRLPGDNALTAKVAEHYPVAASDYIRSHQLAQPLFNAYEWGGFLMWYLPEYPVAIDSRSGLYDDDSIVRYAKVMNAELPYTTDPQFMQARTLLLPRDSLMGEALRGNPSFKVAYEDRVAIVLVREAWRDSAADISRADNGTRDPEILGSTP